MFYIRYIFFVFISITAIYAFNTHKVPQDYSKIQQAINASAAGDTIIVAPGTYLENINFRGKDIFLTSHFYFDGDTSYISSTIIDGSNPANPDSGSVVIINSAESRAAVLQGFTITGGSGTKNYNSSEASTFRTGGGILIDHASPTIKHNIITGNRSNDISGASGAGGGGIRAGQSQTLIYSNMITHNTGGYAGGVMLAYCDGAEFIKNLVAYNEAEGAFDGGGGIYIDWYEVPIINCTIVNNISGDDGGGLIITGTNKNPIKNCIIYNNVAKPTSPGKQIFFRFNGTAAISYCNIEGDASGIKNFDLNPSFADTTLFEIISESPCVDAGVPLPKYYDSEDSEKEGQPMSPSYGTLINDLGWRGGNPHMTFPGDSIITDININRTYLSPGTDTLKISAMITREVEGDYVEAYIFNSQADIAESFELKDDGNGADTLSTDGVFSGTWPIPGSEDYYNVYISVYSEDLGFYTGNEKNPAFTSQGPVKIDGYIFSGSDTIANPGDRITTELSLKNYGATDTVKNIRVGFIPVDGNYLLGRTRGILSYNDLAAGTSFSKQITLQIDDECPVNTIQSLALKIMSDGIFYWTDTLKISVQENVTALEKERSDVLHNFRLFPNSPNPFNPKTTISFEISKPGNVELSIYNLLGEKIKTLVNNPLKPGKYNIQWEGKEDTGALAASGAYIYILKSAGQSLAGKMLLIK